MIHGNKGAVRGGGIEISGGAPLAVAHCSVYSNSATSSGDGIYVWLNSEMRFMNSICWNPGGASNVDASTRGLVVASGSIVGDGAFAGTISGDPMLTKLGFMTKLSAGRGQGDYLYGAPLDIHGEIRPAYFPDVGADELQDSDADGIPDIVEGTNNIDALGDYDGDGITNLVEYENYGTNPLNSDTDGDFISDSSEIFELLTDPKVFDDIADFDFDGDGLSNALESSIGSLLLSFDTNGDNIGDGVTYNLGLDPTSLDPDGDGLDTEQERALGS